MRRITVSFAPSGGGAHLGQHLADGLDCAGDAALAELPHAADTEGFQLRELAGVEDVAARLDGVVEALEGVARVVWCVDRASPCPRSMCCSSVGSAHGARRARLPRDTA